MDKIIESIEIGWGQDSTYYSISGMVMESNKVDEIKEEVKSLGFGAYCELTIIVYRGYKNGNIVFEISSMSNIVIRYKP